MIYTHETYKQSAEICNRYLASTFCFISFDAFVALFWKPFSSKWNGFAAEDDMIFGSKLAI